jgi:hypothetical protein
MDTCGLERVERFRINSNEKNFASQKNTLTSNLPQRYRAVGTCSSDKDALVTTERCKQKLSEAARKMQLTMRGIQVLRLMLTNMHNRQICVALPIAVGDRRNQFSVDHREEPSGACPKLGPKQGLKGLNANKPPTFSIAVDLSRS